MHMFADIADGVSPVSGCPMEGCGPLVIHYHKWQMESIGSHTWP